MFQAALKNNGKDVVKELKREVTGYVTSTMLVCQFAWTLATLVKTLYTKTLRAVKTSPQLFFFVSPSSNFELFIIEPNPSIKYKKKIDVWIN